MSETAKTIAIIGAGIVGVSAAIWLQRDGHRVILIDGKGIGEGASFGNGGVLASAGIVPVTGPGLVGKAPAMLFDPDQPLFLKWSYLPRLLPWLIRYLGHANATDAKRTAAAMAPLVADSLSEHQALAKGTGAERWVVPCDYLYVYRDRAHFESDGFGWSVRKAHGIDWDDLESKALSDYDPAIGAGHGFAARLGNHGRISDPGAYVKALGAHVIARGGRLIEANAEAIVKEGDRVTGVRAGGETIACDAAIVAAGAWSGPLATQLGITAILETERGYHLDLWEPSIMPRAPVMIAASKFVATPMEGRLRLAGIVEFGGLEAPPSRAPFALLERNIRTALPGVTWKDKSEWMGHRPAPANSIPLIGEVPAIRGAYLGFGHHHVGLTSGPKTGRLLAQLFAGRTPNIDMTLYAPQRFQSG